MVKRKNSKLFKRYFITGGTGFIGRRLIEKITKDSNAQVNLYARDSSDASCFEGNEQVRVFRGSLADKKAISQAMKGTDIVFHLAGYAKCWAKDKSIYSKINIEGSLNIAESALANKVKKMVHISTIAALGPTDKNIQDERHEPDKKHQYTIYERTKEEAEKKVLACARNGLNVVVVNPTRVYGPGLISEANSLTLMIKNYLKWRCYLMLGNGKNIANYVYVEDLVDGIILASEKGISGERYILGGENSTLIGFFKTITKVTNKKAIPIMVPIFIALFIGLLNELFASLLGKYPLITRNWVRHFNEDWVYSSTKAKSELGYNPRTLEDGIRSTVEWLKQI
jgi:nucleoside-diphosphate-sugar epimerase